MKKFLFLLLLTVISTPFQLSAQGSAWHLSVIDVKQIPDNYGGFTDTPDIYYILKEGSTVLFTSTPIDDTDPPVSFYPNLALDSTKTYIIEVWDDDLLNADDELGQVSFPGKGSGNLFDSLPNTSGRLELYYEFQFKAVGLEEKVEILSEFEVFPNPAQSYVNLRMTPQVPAQFELQLLDLTGRLVLREDLGMVSFPMDRRLELQGVPAGIYLLQVRNDQGLASRKLVIQP